MTPQVREFVPTDYDAVFSLWRAVGGLMLRDVDSRESVLHYLARNHGLSFVATDNTQVVGAVLCGTDSRRGYLQHLAVAPSYRRRGLGRALVQRSLAALAAQGMDKCHLMVMRENAAARAFWAHLGWHERHDVVLMSHVQSGTAND